MILTRMLANPHLPEKLRQVENWPEAMRLEWGSDEGRTMLAEIYNWFTEGFDTADLKDAKTLLDQLAT